ncbi:hypothetical protein BCR41DRAFT_374095 [Lobosporangium transversale]|uniref:Uncharacterized protein n=1 Tax=Lobosporangium transversale TaxID=64571 RepID=A0A1Y2GBM2_9FUNG|nr:hypothetical protein BCR41DRAFT_374095 [Lobosporangium transversale]ORZ06374.1 hypothetical protein BCR41DRAFT_374095 [Lobosporangium transversale]|eukprot:XP_021877537.1 hypothetical protein BCR41DRAFT_374095 [Lobosporangium transversale]
MPHSNNPFTSRSCTLIARGNGKLTPRSKRCIQSRPELLCVIARYLPQKKVKVLICVCSYVVSGFPASTHSSFSATSPLLKSTACSMFGLYAISLNVSSLIQEERGSYFYGALTQDPTPGHPCSPFAPPLLQLRYLALRSSLRQMVEKWRASMI